MLGSFSAVLLFEHPASIMHIVNMAMIAMLSFFIVGPPEYTFIMRNFTTGFIISNLSIAGPDVQLQQDICLVFIHVLIIFTHI